MKNAATTAKIVQMNVGERDGTTAADIQQIGMYIQDVYAKTTMEK